MLPAAKLNDKIVKLGSQLAAESIKPATTCLLAASFGAKTHKKHNVNVYLQRCNDEMVVAVATGGRHIPSLNLF